MTRIVVIDTETTGVTPSQGDRVIEIAAFEIVDGKVTDNIFHQYINPEGKKSSKRAFSVHRIDDNFLLDKPTFSDIAGEFLAYCEGADEICTYNEKFDLGFIQTELTHSNSDVLLRLKFNTSCLMTDVANKYNGGKWLKLDQACRRFDIDISQRKQHGAKIDAELAAALYIKYHYTEEKPLKHTPQSNKLNPEYLGQKKENERKFRPIPRAFTDPVSKQSIQLNFCKNPNCGNYGIAALNPSLKNGKPLKKLGNSYRISRVRVGKTLYCSLCKTQRILVNNRGFINEVNRLKSEYAVQAICCPDASFGKTRRKNKCRNCTVNFLEKPERYNLKDIYYDESGTPVSQRLQCRACKQSFRVPLIGRIGKQKTDIDVHLFRALVNKVVLNRITEIFDIEMSFIYSRIEFYYRQCIEFDRWHVQQNIQALKHRQLTIGMDRQHYLVNWTDTNDSRPTKIVNTSSVDNDSRFVFLSTINFDITSDWRAIRKDSERLRDHEKEVWQRKYAQYTIREADLEKDDVGDDIELKTPVEGLLVQQTYSAMAHLELMKEFYEHAEHVTLYADNDEGFDLSISIVLREMIDNYHVFAYLIKAERNNATQAQDKQAWSEEILQRHNLSRKKIDKLPPEFREEELLKLSQKYWIAESQARKNKSGYAKSEWIVHPFTGLDRSIQVKSIKNLFESDSLLDEIFEMTGSNASEDLLYSSLHGVDNYFQMVRRRLNVLERPVTSATNGHRWNGYASYNPKWSVMLLEILRVYLNYVVDDEKTLKNKKYKQGERPLTPAQKIGFADKKYTIEEILDFTAANEVIKIKRGVR